MNDYKGSFLPLCIPYLFVYCDSEKMSERAREFLYGQDQTIFSGSDFNQKLKKQDIAKIIETILFLNTGESILRIVYDSKGDMIPFRNVKMLDSYKHVTLSANVNPEIFELKEK